MYDKDRGELLYSPQRGHYYENDDKNRKKNIIVVVLVLLFSAFSGYVAYKFTHNDTKVIKPTKSKPVEAKKIEPKVTQPIPTTTIVDKNISKKVEELIVIKPIKVEAKKVVKKEIDNKQPKDINITQEPTFNRGATPLFFTSMGKSVDGAKIEQNIQKVELKVVDTKKIRDELTKKEKKNIKKKKKKKTTTIKVKRGDTIYKISKKVYGDSRKYKIILKANGITKPSSLKIGQVLKIPHD